MLTLIKEAGLQFSNPGKTEPTPEFQEYLFLIDFFSCIFNPFQANVSPLYPLRTLENQRPSGTLKGR